MSRKGRVLVVEDNLGWADLVALILKREGLDVGTAGTLAQAKELMKENLYHLLILDIHLPDSDNAGMEYLRDLSEQGIPKVALEIIMLTAHPTEQRMREAFSKREVRNFFSKQDFDDDEFLKAVRKLFDDELKINFDLEIHWQLKEPQKAVLNLEIFGKRIKDNTPLQKQITTELEDLLCRVFYDANSILVHPLEPGYSGTGILRIQPFYETGGGAQSVAFKFGDYNKIKTEQEHFDKYASPYLGGARRTTVENVRYTYNLGGIAYNFLGTSGNKMEDFRSFYKRSETPQIFEALDNVFRDTCRGWYANLSPLVPLNLTEEYKKRLNLSRENLEIALHERLRKSVQGKDYLVFDSLSERRRFVNPIDFTLEYDHIVPTYECINHGDFNANNILLDSEGKSWLIDFLHTGYGHALRDFAKLDTEIRVLLLADGEATLDERLLLEEALLETNSFRNLRQPGRKPATENPYLLKAFDTIVHLRNIACDLINNLDGDTRSYLIATQFFALNSIRFYPLPKIQREHGLLSTSILAESLRS